MKKVLGILLTIAMVSSVFAAEPVADVKVAEFSGNASVSFVADLDTEKTGFEHDTGVTLNLNLFNGGSKSTTGDGVWAELVLKTDGDNPRFYVDDVSGKVVKITEAYEVKVDTAKFHFGDVYVDIKKGDFRMDGDFYYPNALNYKDTDEDGLTVRDRTSALYANGLGIGYKSDMFGVEGEVRSSAIDSNYALGGYGWVKPITDLRVAGGVAYVLDGSLKDAMAIFVGAEYKLALGDTYFLQPVVTYRNENLEAGTEINRVQGGLRFGWAGSVDSSSMIDDWFEARYPLATEDDDDLLPGLSVYTSYDLTKDSDDVFIIPVMVEFFSGEIVENLSAYAFYSTTVAGNKLTKDGGSYSHDLSAVVKYVIPMDEASIVPAAGFYNEYTKDDAVTEVRVQAEFKNFINNTTFTAKWADAVLADDDDKDAKGKLSFTAKIAL